MDFEVEAKKIDSEIKGIKKLLIKEGVGNYYSGDELNNLSHRINDYYREERCLGAMKIGDDSFRCNLPAYHGGHCQFITNELC